ncbi:MAG: 2-succinyl-6-hydroxy-2,4-cyclohexadiene-1-carboxylate synthase [Oscillatoria sp. PMC 1051.18]|nr:2-succinyl-6-hydroxy-2,4-cyclohexadiene-1-carboxylate synthase [Oscillatoria sp. PMC 1050.18]MEC5031232.1 2-succinyl-6-hydroxy-2,4-cyclohexadiene-1-carboxylate synthase [Oscillatoria sp. PMC 1051.18]
MKSPKYQFNYQLIGAQNKSIICFLHGFMGDNRDFESVVNLLTAEFRCLVIDLPGHGKTKINGNESCYNLPNTAQALVDLLVELNLKKSYLVGYSMGGRLALYLAIHYPQYFPKLVLESASPGLATALERRQRKQRDEQLAREIETSNFSAFVNKWYQQPLFASLKSYPQWEKMKARRLENNPAELTKSLRNLGTGSQPSLWAKLTSFSQPLLLLVGEKDAKFIAINSQMQQLCPSAELSIVPNCGHNIHLENEAQFVQIVKQFLQT